MLTCYGIADVILVRDTISGFNKIRRNHLDDKNYEDLVTLG